MTLDSQPAPSGASSSAPVTFSTVPSSTPEAQACQDAYYAELSVRFKEGFDHARYAGKSSTGTPTSSTAPVSGDADGTAEADEHDDDSAQFTPPVGAFILVRLGSEVVGCGGVRLLEPTAEGQVVAELKRMWLAPAARGKGIASKLLVHLESVAVKDLSAKFIRLDTKDVLPEAIKLYSKNGYYAIPRYNDNPYATHFFEKAF